MKHILTIALLALSLGAAAQTGKCKGTTAKGAACRMLATTDGYCRFHSPSRVHCAGVNGKGKPCGLAPVKGTKYCRYHGQ